MNSPCPFQVAAVSRSCQQPQTTTQRQHWPWPLCLTLAQGNWVDVGHAGFKPEAISFHWRNSCCLVRAYGSPAWSEEWVKIPPAMLWKAGKVPWPLPLNSHCTNIAAQTVSHPLILDEQLRLKLVLPEARKCLKLADGYPFSYLNASLLYSQLWRNTFVSVLSG